MTSSAPPPATAAVSARSTSFRSSLATRLNSTFTKVVRARLTDDPDTADTRKYLGPAREAMAAEVADLLAILNHRLRQAAER